MSTLEQHPVGKYFDVGNQIQPQNIHPLQFYFLNDQREQRSSTIPDSIKSQAEVSDQDLTLYNELYSSHIIFKKSFEIEMDKFKLALRSSIKEVLGQLPREVRSMQASQFVGQATNDLNFALAFNHQLAMTDKTTLNLMGSIKNLLKPSIYDKIIEKQQRKSRKQDQIREGKEDKGIQCRFSQRLSGIGLEQEREQAIREGVENQQIQLQEGIQSNMSDYGGDNKTQQKEMQRILQDAHEIQAVSNGYQTDNEGEKSQRSAKFFGENNAVKEETEEEVKQLGKRQKHLQYTQKTKEKHADDHFLQDSSVLTRSQYRQKIQKSQSPMGVHTRRAVKKLFQVEKPLEKPKIEQIDKTQRQKPKQLPDQSEKSEKPRPKQPSSPQAKPLTRSRVRHMK